MNEINQKNNILHVNTFNSNNEDESTKNQNNPVGLEA